MKASPFSDVYKQYFLEASFLYVLRDSMLSNGATKLSVIKETEKRLQKHINGLLLDVSAAWEICSDALDYREPGEVFVSTIIAFHHPGIYLLNPVINVAGENERNFDAFLAASIWLPEVVLHPALNTLLASRNFNFVFVGISILSARRKVKGVNLNSIFDKAINSGDVRLISCMLKLIGEMKLTKYSYLLEKFRTSSNRHLSFWSLWGLLMLGNKDACSDLKSYVFNENSYQDLAVDSVLRALSMSEAHDWLESLKLKTYSDIISLRISELSSLFDSSPIAIDFFSNGRFPQHSLSAITDVENEVDVRKMALNYSTSVKYNIHAASKKSDDITVRKVNVRKIEPQWPNDSVRHNANQHYINDRPVLKNTIQEVSMSSCQREREIILLENALAFPTHIYDNNRSKLISSE